VKLKLKQAITINRCNGLKNK